MRIAVIGAGAIGCLVAGYLKLKNEDVLLIGHPESVKAVREKGISISGVRGTVSVRIDAAERLDVDAGLVILAVKTQDIQAALKENVNGLHNAFLLTTQNGLQAEHIAAGYFDRERIFTSIVMFGATYLAPGTVVHNFEGSWIIGRLSGKPDENLLAVANTLNTIFPSVITEDIKGMKYLKVFVNANNCIPAILGVSMQEAFADPFISRAAVAVWKEGMDIVSRTGTHLEGLPDFPVLRLTRLTSLPAEEAAKIFSGIMTSLSREPLYGSILQSIRRGRPSEIDYINGAFVALAKNNNLDAPLNERLVDLVHQVEREKKFLTRGEFLSAVKGLV
ncbi:MAG: ketopantoate reductase family protein [Candidatus Omnitrophica bacterium]|nr:ketopantoate reductase family protein [Candidatus Omnitrophota bacterium]